MIFAFTAGDGYSCAGAAAVGAVSRLLLSELRTPGSRTPSDPTDLQRKGAPDSNRGHVLALYGLVLMVLWGWLSLTPPNAAGTDPTGTAASPASASPARRVRLALRHYL